MAALGFGVQPRASGGPVSAGAPYLVGEAGPELFVPSSAGSIVPNGGGGMAVALNVPRQPLGLTPVANCGGRLERAGRCDAPLRRAAAEPMSLSGNQKALMYALGAVARGGATRGGYHSMLPYVSIGGSVGGGGRVLVAMLSRFHTASSA